MPFGKDKTARVDSVYREHEEKIMAEARESRLKEEDKKWEQIKEDLYVGSLPHDSSVDLVLDSLREKYNLPTKI